jgi:hypothetical protein
MGRQKFIDELTAMGYQPEPKNGNLVAFRYTIPVGKFSEKEIILGFAVNEDFPLNPPGGPHVSPCLLPLNPSGGTHPNCGVHNSPFGDGWQYWSRPFQNWPGTKRTVRAYMAHIRHLFDSL